ncbi:MAG: glycosyltransferase family 2 protein [Desulfobacterales bacterium]|nr:glycosyltransferase family 2 protein [Desulfobacterales bacterium]
MKQKKTTFHQQRLYQAQHGSDNVNPGDKKIGSIALIIVNWNSGDWLNKCFRGIAAQTLQPQQVILVDNASTDGSLEGVEEILPDVKVIRETKNSGFARGNNIALKSIDTTQWTVLLNPDAIPEPEWLENLMLTAHAYPEYSFFACKMLDPADSSRLDGVGDAYHTSGYAWRQGFGQESTRIGETAKECFSPCAAAAMYRTDIIQQAGGFDESFFCYFEDIDLGFRLRLLGYRCLYIPTAVVSHAGSAMTGKRSDFSVYYGHRNMMWTYCKNMPWPLFWIYLPQHILINIMAIFILSLRGQGAIAVQAKYDAIKRLPVVWSDRREIQLNRQVRSIDLWRVMLKGFYSLFKRN